jgi:hypothetical protein
MVMTPESSTQPLDTIQSQFYPCTTLTIYLSIYLQLFVDLRRFFSFLICTQSAGLCGLEISPSQGRYLHTEQHKHRINAHRHPCLEWDSNPRSQRSSERRRFMPLIPFSIFKRHFPTGLCATILQAYLCFMTASVV